MGKNNPLTQKVNFILAVTLLGSAALFAIVTMLEAADMENPFSEHRATIIEYEEAI